MGKAYKSMVINEGYSHNFDIYFACDNIQNESLDETTQSEQIDENPKENNG